MKHEYTKELNHYPYKPMMAILVVYEVLLRLQSNDDEYIHPLSIDHQLLDSQDRTDPRILRMNP